VTFEYQLKWRSMRLCVQKFEIYTRARITAAVFLFARTWAAHTEYHVAGAHNIEGAQRVMKRNNSKVYQRRAPSEKNVENLRLRVPEILHNALSPACI
jgi:hypothetical protein